MTLPIKSYYSLYLFLFTAPLGVCTIVFGQLDEIILVICTVMSLFFIKWRHLKVSQPLSWIIWLFYLPSFVSLCWSFVLLPFINEPEYYDYVNSTLVFRVLHIVFYLIILIYANELIQNNYSSFLIKCLKVIVCGIVVFLIIFAIWQLLSNLLGIWIPKIKTRGDFYSDSSLGLSRITSLANEPSYFVPFVIDGIIILSYLRKLSLAICLSLILLFSLSFGGIGEAIILCLYYYFFSSTTKKIKILCGLGCMIVFLLLVFPSLFDLIIQIISVRKELHSGFNLNQTSRTIMLVYPVKKWMDFDVISLLIGYGPGSFKFLFYSNPSEALFVTSNNILTDLIYEEGILGVILYIFLLRQFWKEFKLLRGRESIIGRILVIHIFLSSLYRADYVSARYDMLFIILLIFYQLFNRQKKHLNEISKDLLI